VSARVGRVIRVAVVLVIATALVAFARTVHWREAWAAMRQASPPLLAAAAAVNLASLLAKGVRWWIFLRPIGVGSLWLAIRATFVGAGLNNILIANGGEAARVVFVARAAHVPSERVLATLALERLFEVAGYVLLLSLALSTMALPGPLSGSRPLAIAALAGMVVLLAYLVRHPERAELPPIQGDGLLERARRYGSGFLRTLTGMSTTRRFAGALACAMVVWALQLASYHLTALAAGLEITLAGSLATLLAVNLGFAVRATPGNVGVFQMLYALAAVGFGVDRDAATGVAFLIQIQQVLPVTLLGLLGAPALILERRERSRPDNLLPGEPVDG